MKTSEIHQYRPLDFVADMNADGRITISDVWLWLKWLYFYPGDVIVGVLVGTGFGNFFELSANDFGGLLSSFISLAFWLLVFVVWIIFQASEPSNRSARQD